MSDQMDRVDQPDPESDLEELRDALIALAFACGIDDQVDAADFAERMIMILTGARS